MKPLREVEFRNLWHSQPRGGSCKVQSPVHFLLINPPESQRWWIEGIRVKRNVNIATMFFVKTGVNVRISEKTGGHTYVVVSMNSVCPYR